MGNTWVRLTPEGEDQNDLAICQIDIDIGKATLAAGFIFDGEIERNTDVLPFALIIAELNALARLAPDVKALVEVATAAAEYMSDADLCDADTEWRLGTEVRAALAPFQEASGG